ncbi:MAG TPA: hypothetical protein PK648_15830 [Verrucomicrobiales bacterium]|nr:hypothetical protein [Verrucomicrobiales bacterium]
MNIEWLYALFLYDEISRMRILDSKAQFLVYEARDTKIILLKLEIMRLKELDEL